MSENKCCGASDVGTITDQAALQQSRKKVVSMDCLAIINNQLGFVMDSVKEASRSKKI